MDWVVICGGGREGRDDDDDEDDVPFPPLPPPLNNVPTNAFPIPIPFETSDDRIEEMVDFNG